MGNTCHGLLSTKRVIYQYPDREGAEVNRYSPVTSLSLQYNYSLHNMWPVIGFPENTGERAENSVQQIGCLMKMTHVDVEYSQREV